MPISSTGQVLPQKPIALDLTTAAYFEDFIYNTTGPVANNITGSSGFTFGNPLGADAAHPGVYANQLSGGAGAFTLGAAGGATQGFSLQTYAAANLEFMWQITANPATRIQFAMGWTRANGCGLLANEAALQFSTAAGCAAMNNDHLWLSSKDAATEVDVDTGVSMAALYGGWHKTNIVWNNSAQSLTLLLDGVQKAQITTHLPTLAGMIAPVFQVSGFNFVNPAAGIYLLVDYVKISRTISR